VNNSVKKMSENKHSKLSFSTIDIRVYIEDTDAGGIVFYVNYLKYMERARTEFMRQLGFGKAAVFAEQQMFVVHSLTINYRAPAILDDCLTISAKVKKVTKVAVIFEQQVHRENQLLCEAEVKVACVDRLSQQPATMPESLFNKIQTQ
tara:strand:+ start:2076 stop:2519 length:444 start_codon:yes stop_codon:yes gene_type:complete